MWNPVNYQMFGIPTPTKTTFTYVNGGAPNDIVATQTFFDKAGNQIGVLAFSYDGNNNLTEIERTDNVDF